MYHFIHHGTDDQVFKGIPGLPMQDFEKQINYLCNKFEPVTHRDLSRYFDCNCSLPEKSFYLTFDEGLKQHIGNVLPILEKNQLKASFFIPTKPLQERAISTVEKQRICQYTCFKDYKEFLMLFVETVIELYPYLESKELYPSDENIQDSKNYLNEFEFYSNEERFYRKIRNTYLSEQVFNNVIDKIFMGFYTGDHEFIDRYYLTWKEINDMQAMGMEIGGHSHSHPMLDKISKQEMKREIDLSINILNSRLKKNIDAYAYPYGSYSGEVINYLKEKGMSYAFATGNTVNQYPLNRYELMRIDEASFKFK